MIPIIVQSDVVVLELMKYKDYYTDNYQKKKYVSLEHKKIKKMKNFISLIIHNTEKIIILIPPHADIEDYIEIFDDILFEEKLQ